MIFGGRPASNATGDTARETWEWDGATWTLASANSGALYGLGAPMAYDEVLHKVVVFSGKDTWSWNGGAWTLIVPEANSPPPRGYAAMAWDAQRRRVVMFGGGSDSHVWEWNGAALP